MCVDRAGCFGAELARPLSNIPLHPTALSYRPPLPPNARTPGHRAEKEDHPSALWQARILVLPPPRYTLDGDISLPARTHVASHRLRGQWICLRSSRGVSIPSILCRPLVGKWSASPSPPSFRRHRQSTSASLLISSKLQIRS